MTRRRPNASICSTAPSWWARSRCSSPSSRCSCPTTPTAACRSCPTKRLVFESPNGVRADRRQPGARGRPPRGIVTDLDPVRKENGDTVAKITIKLDGSYGDVPADSTVAIRPLSLSGLKYVELTRGESRRALFDGDTIPVEQARVPVQLDDLGNMYNRGHPPGSPRRHRRAPATALAAARTQTSTRRSATCRGSCATSSRWHARSETPTPTSALPRSPRPHGRQPWRPRPTPTRTASRRARTRWRRGRETRAACGSRCARGRGRSTWASPRCGCSGRSSRTSARPRWRSEGRRRSCRATCRGSSPLSIGASTVQPQSCRGCIAQLSRRSSRSSSS